MYEVTPQMQRQHLGHASTDFFDDDYDVYLLWHTTSPYVIMPVELVDGYEVRDLVGSFVARFPGA